MFSPNAFEHLRPKPAKTYEHILHGVHYPASNPNPIVLHLVFCGRGSPYWNAITKFKSLADEKAATKRAASKFAELGVVGWGNVEAPFTAEDCEKLLTMLVDVNRDEIVDRAITVAMTPDNFTEAAPDGVELGKK